MVEHNKYEKAWEPIEEMYEGDRVTMMLCGNQRDEVVNITNMMYKHGYRVDVGSMSEVEGCVVIKFVPKEDSKKKYSVRSD